MQMGRGSLEICFSMLLMETAGSVNLFWTMDLPISHYPFHGAVLTNWNAIREVVGGYHFIQ